MLLTEYDEERHMRDTYKEGYEEGEQIGYSKGEQAGRDALLEEQVWKKLERGKTIEVIAEELEQEIAVVKQVVERIRR